MARNLTIVVTTKDVDAAGNRYPLTEKQLKAIDTVCSCPMEAMIIEVVAPLLGSHAVHPNDVDRLLQVLFSETVLAIHIDHCRDIRRKQQQYSVEFTLEDSVARKTAGNPAVSEPAKRRMIIRTLDV